MLYIQIQTKNYDQIIGVLGNKSLLTIEKSKNLATFFYTDIRKFIKSLILLNKSYSDIKKTIVISGNDTICNTISIDNTYKDGSFVNYYMTIVDNDLKFSVKDDDKQFLPENGMIFNDGFKIAINDVNSEFLVQLETEISFIESCLNLKAFV